MAMQKEFIELPAKKLIGIKARTSNADEMIGKGVIGPMIGRFYAEQLGSKIKSPRAKAGVAFSLFTDFDTDHTGPYTYFIGEEVRSFENESQDLVQIEIPAQKYVVFTTDAGPMPMVEINAWQQIWQMNENAFGGKRNYLADFVIYDEKASNPLSAVISIYLGINGNGL